jgi:rhodanese-related sulfurtransferase
MQSTSTDASQQVAAPRLEEIANMNTRWIAAVTLIAIPIFAWQAVGAPQQASKTEASTPAAGVSERIKEVSTSQLNEWMTGRQKFTLIDVREDNEWLDGHAAMAMHISRGALIGKIGSVVPDKTARIVLYCLGGVRSAAAAETLQKIGYTNVYSLTGGFKNYQLAGLPVQE